MNQEVYTYWLEVASRLTRNGDDARDLLHDALEVAIEQSRMEISREDHAGWFYGVLRNLRAQKARGKARRKSRERKVVDNAALMNRTESDSAERSTISEKVSELVSELSPAIRVVVLLQLHGLSDREIGPVLGISNAAYRKRLQKAREHLRLLPEETRFEIVKTSRVKQEARAEVFDVGLIREALLNKMLANTGHERELGTHDPDGHLLVFGAGRKKISKKP